MSKRYNKQNRGNKPPHKIQSNNAMSERKKKIYAYILAGFIIFWNVASVLGIVAFVRSFAKDDNSSEERSSVAVSQVIDDNDVQRLGSVVSAKAAEPVHYQQLDLGLQGCTIPPSHEYDNYVCFADGNSFVRFTTDGSFYVAFEGVNLVPAGGGLTVLRVPVNAFRITGGNPYMDKHTLFAGATYSNHNGYKFSNNSDMYVHHIMVNAYLDAAPEVSTFARKLRLVYTFKWYDNAVYLGDSTLSLIFNGYYVYHERWDFLYPYKGVSRLVSGAEPTIEVNVGRINNTYLEDYRNGFDNGVLDAHSFTFENLLTSVIDVPIRAFTDLFNFELLGVNLASFFFALISVCTVIAVIKLFI